MDSCFQVTISGRVQGVGFRYWLRLTAEQAGLCGIVRNLPDGRVYAEVEGKKSVALEFIDQCHKGPALAHVTKVAVIETDVRGYRNFTIVR